MSESKQAFVEKKHLPEQMPQYLFPQAKKAEEKEDIFSSNI